MIANLSSLIYFTLCGAIIGKSLQTDPCKPIMAASWAAQLGRTGSFRRKAGEAVARRQEAGALPSVLLQPYLLLPQVNSLHLAAAHLARVRPECLEWLGAAVDSP